MSSRWSGSRDYRSGKGGCKISASFNAVILRSPLLRLYLTLSVRENRKFFVTVADGLQDISNIFVSNATSAAGALTTSTFGLILTGDLNG